MQKSQRGFALVIVIWILTLLSLMAGSFALTMRRDSGVTSAQKNNAQASALSESGLAMAEYMLQQADPDRRWLTDGSIYQILRSDGSEIRVKLVSEAGKIDINAADESLLLAVIKAVSSDLWEQQRLLNSILDWRDEDNEQRPHGAEKKQYQEAGLSYIPSNKPFQSLDELQLVLGINAEIFNRIQPWLTVYSGQSQVNLQEATPEVAQIINNDLNDKHISNPATPSQTPNNTPPAGNPNNLGAANNENRTYTVAVEVFMRDGGSAALETVVKIQSQNSGMGQTPGQGQTSGQGQIPGQGQLPGQAPLQILDWKQNQMARSLFSNDVNSQLITVQDEFTNNY
jgi:general secretion pathway protein K